MRFLAFRWRPTDKALERRCRLMWAKVETRHRWMRVIDRRGVLLYVACGTTPIIALPNEYGAILGDLYHQDGTRARTFLLDDVLRLVETGGAPLAEAHWGAYSAILHDRGHDILHVVRDPAASSQIFWSEVEAGANIIFSHASDYVAAGGPAEVDELWLQAFLVRPRLVARSTGLDGVNELLAGERITFSRDDWVVEPAWLPPRYAAGNKFKPSFEAAAAVLHRSIVSVASAWSDQRRMIVHRLSGGLDSSIALAALKEGGANEITCINQFPAGQPEGDERYFARIVARHFGVSLHEIEFAPHNVEYERLGEIELTAKPSLADLSFADGVAIDRFSEIGPDLVTSGQGGDQLFHRSHKATIAADAYRDGLPFEMLRLVAYDTAKLARCPMWDVLAAIARFGVLKRRSDPMRAMACPELISKVGASEVADAFAQTHLWRPLMLAAGPARALRLSHIAGLDYYHHANALSARFTVAPILASQPIIDFCLSVPPYVMTAGGRDRALARAAFSSMLPEPILDRKSKATTTRFHTAVLERQLPFIRAMLRGGALEGRGLIRADALESALSRGVVADAVMSDALTTALVAEMWLRRLNRAVQTRTESQGHVQSQAIVPDVQSEPDRAA